jgi:threonine/homoserine/homoserine lactone efflux protein
MPISPNYIIFVLACLALLLTPGPAVLYIIARSVDQGRMAGFVSSLGVGLGSLVHVIGAAIGLSALLVQSALAFSIVKYLGAAYLVYLGIRKLTSKSELEEGKPVERKKLHQIFRQGVVVNILNPKTALFFFAFLPQFVDPALGSFGAQIFFLGATFVTLGIITDSLYALLTGSAGTWLKQNRGFLRNEKYFSGGIYILLGIGTAFSGSGKSS